MPEQSYNVVVSQPSQLFTLARSFKANANGKIYIGKIDTDPTIPENQIQVYIDNEDGTQVPVAQPIIINSGGYPVYGGQIVKFVTVQGHSMAIYDSYGAQQFYFPNVLKYDPDQFKQLLATSAGASYIGASPSGNVQNFIDVMNQRVLYITPQMFGAKGDYIASTDSGTDDTQAFIDAIAAAISLGYRKVVVPAGYNYLITSTINLGGVGFVGLAGVALVGENWMNTNIYFRAPSADAPCIAMLGGSSLPSAKYVEGMTIQPTIATRYTGVGVRLAGACFSKNSKLWIRQFGVNLHLLNNLHAGVFTEFNEFRECRFHRGLVNILMEANGGDNSFHGNDFWGVQNQVKTSVNGGDGNTTPGVGFELRGLTSPVYWYNAFCFMHFFGGPDAVAIKTTKGNTDNISGMLTGEGNLIIQSTDAASSFQFRGGFNSIGSISYVVPSEPTTSVSTFVFDNSISNSAAFASTGMTGLSPRVMPISFADRTDNGGFPAIFRSVGSNTDSLCYASGADANSHHYFGYIPASGNLQAFVPGLRINHDGGAIVSYSATLYLNTSGSGGVQLGTNLFAPRADNTTSCGSGGFRWSVVYAGSGTINTSDEKTKKFRETDETIAFAEKEAALEIKKSIRAFQFKDALADKEGNARFHIGVGAQTVVRILSDNGLNPDDYAFVTLEQWPTEYDENGVVIRESGSLYGIRYEELTMFIMMNT